jgi:twinkle protein
MKLNGFEIDIFNVHGIRQGATSWTCPLCSHERKKKTEKCMSVFWDTGLGKCNHCGETVQLHTYKKQHELQKQEPNNYKKPEYKPFEGVYSERMQSYVSNTRKIDLSFLKRFKIRETKEWMPQTKKEENCIAFDYFYEGILINTKFRDGAKNFKLVTGAEKILYNIDSIKGTKTAMIVEGEFDAVCWTMAGYDPVVSVPNGFTTKGNINLDYLDNYIHLFDDKETIYIAVDNDLAGNRGRDELVRRFGAERCKIVTYGDQKDANDYLIKYGKTALYDCISQSKDVKVEGIFTVDDVEAELWNRFKNGQKRGTSTHITNVDKAWTWREGEVTMWTGYENEGKSLFLNQLALIKAVYDGWKFGIFSPENTPIEDFFNDLIEMYIGKSTDPVYKSNYMSDDEFRTALEFIKKHFFVIYPDKDFKLMTVFEKAKYLVMKHGIRGLIIDPYNTIEHQLERGEREDLYISRFMGQLKRLAVECNISVNLVAHQNTAHKNKDDGGRYFRPDLNNIKGGGTFSAKTDNACIVWRPNRALDFKDPEVIFASQKIKKQKLVGQPQSIEYIVFDIKKQRYYFNGFNPLDLIDKVREGYESVLKLNVETGEYESNDPSYDTFKSNNINGVSQFENIEENEEFKQDECPF